MDLLIKVLLNKLLSLKLVLYPLSSLLACASLLTGRPTYGLPGLKCPKKVNMSTYLYAVIQRACR